MTNDQINTDTAKDILRFYEYLKQVRQPFEPMIDDILEFVRQSRKISSTTKGEKLTSNIYNGKALEALNLWADGMYGYLCSPNLDWFSLTLPMTVNFGRISALRKYNNKRLDDLPEVAEWLNASEEHMRSVFLRSNFYAVMPQFFRDGGSVGTAVMDIEEDINPMYAPDAGRIFFTPLHFRECYLAENKNGLVDTLYRRQPVTLRNLVQRFGLEKLTDVDRDFKNKYEHNPYEEVYVIRAVQPRLDFDPERIDAKGKRWASYWLLEGKSEKLLDEGGYNRFPSVAWRYRKETDEPYGRSPAWDAYSEIMLSQQEARTNLIAGQKMAEPAWVLLEDLRGRFNDGPKGKTFVESMTDAPQTLNQNINLPFSLELMERTEKAIEKHFNVDFFIMLSQAAYNRIELTATQVIQMAGEKAAVLATRTDTLNMEALNPIIDRVWDIEKRRLPPPPPVLAEFANANIEIDYLGPLAQAQKVMFETQGLKASMETAMQISQIFPDSIDVLDGDEIMRRVFKANRAPAAVIRSEDGTKQIRQMRIQQQQEAASVEQISQIASALPGATKSIEKGSALDVLTGGQLGNLQGSQQ
jgi:hypothetical protein